MTRTAPDEATEASGDSTVMTVTGPRPTADLGTTLTHEHVFNNVESWAHRTRSRGWDPDDLAMRPYIAALNTAIEAGRVTWAGFYYIRHENKDGQDIYHVHPY